MVHLGHSWVVPVPARVRAHLGWAVGAAVYWHLTGPHEATLTPHEYRPGGKPPGLDLGPQVHQLRRENERLRKRLQARPLAVLHEGMSQGAAVGVKMAVDLGAEVAVLRERIERLIDLVSPHARTIRRPRRRPAAADAQPFPPAPPSANVEQGSPASGTASPQAAHAEPRPAADVSPGSDGGAPAATPGAATPTTCPDCGALKLDDEPCPVCV